MEDYLSNTLKNNRIMKHLNTTVRKWDAFKWSQIYEWHRWSYVKLSAEVVDVFGFSELAPQFYIQYQSINFMGVAGCYQWFVFSETMDQLFYKRI